MVIRTSEAAAASRGDFARCAPCATNSSARDAVRFHTVTSKPFLSKFAAIGLPIKPNPITPTEVFMTPLPKNSAGTF